MRDAAQWLLLRPRVSCKVLAPRLRSLAAACLHWQHPSENPLLILFSIRQGSKLPEDRILRYQMISMDEGTVNKSYLFRRRKNNQSCGRFHFFLFIPTWLNDWEHRVISKDPLGIGVLKRYVTQRLKLWWWCRYVCMIGWFYYYCDIWFFFDP